MGNSNPEPPLCYPVKEATRLLGLGRTTVYKLLKSGELKSVRDRGRRLVPRDALLEYDARRKAAAGWGAPNAVGGPGGRTARSRRRARAPRCPRTVRGSTGTMSGAWSAGAGCSLPMTR